MIRVGDQVVVYGVMPPAMVEKIWTDPKTKVVTIELDWGERGHSRVYAHDENDIWYKYTGTN